LEFVIPASQFPGQELGNRMTVIDFFVRLMNKLADGILSELNSVLLELRAKGPVVKP
jgi:hypothetical protein